MVWKHCEKKCEEPIYSETIIISRKTLSPKIFSSVLWRSYVIVTMKTKAYIGNVENNKHQILMNITPKVEHLCSPC